MTDNSNNSRRNFLRKSLASGAFIGLSALSGQAITNNFIQNGDVIPDFETIAGCVQNLTCEPMDTVRIGIIGLGMRGSEAVRRLLLLEGVEIKAICDVVPELVKKAQEQIIKAGKAKSLEFTSAPEAWKKLCECEDIDLVYACTPWDLHTPNAVYAMNHGKHAAVEVPIALSVDECWQLVKTSEKTKKHCMQLENCCYDFFELATLNMAQKGVFGEVMHAECAYIHDLRSLKFSKTGYYDMWRLKHSMHHTGNPYPTHGLGPVCQIMNINRGDRMEMLTSMSTNQVGMSLYANEKYGKTSPEALQNYKLGDMNTTLIRTAKGHTIMVQHDTTSPRPYDRIHKISGTKGFAQKYPDKRIALEPAAHEWLSKEKFDILMKEYEHPLTKTIGEVAKKVGGHGGMDFMMDWRLIYCLRKGLPLDQTVYDAATWSCIVGVSEKSVLNGSSPVKIPDFTRGAWKTTKPFELIV